MDQKTPSKCTLITGIMLFCSTWKVFKLTTLWHYSCKEKGNWIPLKSAATAAHLWNFCAIHPGTQIYVQYGSKEHLSEKTFGSPVCIKDFSELLSSLTQSFFRRSLNLLLYYSNDGSLNAHNWIWPLTAHTSLHNIFPGSAVWEEGYFVMI